MLFYSLFFVFYAKLVLAYSANRGIQLQKFPTFPFPANFPRVYEKCHQILFFLSFSQAIKKMSTKDEIHSCLKFQKQPGLRFLHCQ